MLDINELIYSGKDSEAEVEEDDTVFSKGAFAAVAADMGLNLANVGFTGLAVSGVEYVPY